MGNFNLALGLKLKEEGMQGSSRQEILELARKIAKEVALSKPDRLCCIDEVRMKMGEKYNKLGNARGSVFRESCWVFTGNRSPSSWAPNHAHENKVWKLQIN